MEVCMYCPSFGNESAVELKCCNRCGANLAVGTSNQPALVVAPVKLTVPSIVLGLTITGGLGIIFGGAAQFAMVGVHPAAIVWMVLFSTATLFGCIALMIRFWTKMLTLQRDAIAPQPLGPTMVERRNLLSLPPRLEPGPIVTGNTTITYAPIYA